MSSQITIVWIVNQNLKADLDKVLKNFGASKIALSQYELGAYKCTGLTIKLYEKKLLVQGVRTDDGLKLLQEIRKIKGLALDAKNAERLAQIFPTFQNALLCAECGSPFLLVEAEINGLDVSFKNECKCNNALRPPLLMLNNRILPDVNILVGNNLSRYINLGYFAGFEIIIPDLIMFAIDNLLGPKKKSGVSGEIEKLRRMQKEGKISLIDFKDNLKSQVTNERDFEKQEDDLILEIATMTNSILLTGDNTLKDKAIIKKRPTIYVPPEIGGAVKHIEDVRSP